MVSLIKKMAETLGLVIARKQPWMGNEEWLKDYNIKSILDIGANVGKFATYYNDLLPDSTIYAFEPIKSVYDELVKNTKNHNVKTYNYGLGDKEETLSINVNEFSPSSSILEMTPTHRKNVARAQKTTKETISIKRLDDVFKASDFEKNLMVKIDVQGFEDKTIRGGMEIISHAKILMVEVTFQELYQDQKLFHELYTQLNELGFEYAGSLEQYFDRDNGSLLYADALFINRKN